MEAGMCITTWLLPAILYNLEVKPLVDIDYNTRCYKFVCL